MGLRGIASGGIAFMLDNKGKDRYEAGHFSQGGGYYFGWGILINKGDEDDLYIGSRYNQGFTAHQAAGYFYEQGGNDIYRSYSVSLGMAWDQSVVVFIDEKGDDKFNTSGTAYAVSKISPWADSMRSTPQMP